MRRHPVGELFIKVLESGLITEEDSGGQEDGRTEGVGAAVVAGCNAPPLTQVESQGAIFTVTDHRELAGYAPLGATVRRAPLC